MPKYIIGDLSKVASWYYRNDYENKIRFEIYEAMKDKLHPRCTIEYEFNPETAKEIERILKKIK